MIIIALRHTPRLVAIRLVSISVSKKDLVVAKALALISRGSTTITHQTLILLYVILIVQSVLAIQKP
jgi:hypothetical protein